jgi:hypothetical protein
MSHIATAPAAVRRNIIAIIGDVAFFMLGFSCMDPTTVMPQFLKELGASPQLIGLISGLRLLVLFAPQPMWPTVYTAGACQTFSHYRVRHRQTADVLAVPADMGVRSPPPRWRYGRSCCSACCLLARMASASCPGRRLSASPSHQTFGAFLRCDADGLLAGSAGRARAGQYDPEYPCADLPAKLRYSDTANGYRAAAVDVDASIDSGTRHAATGRP